MLEREREVARPHLQRRRRQGVVRRGADVGAREVTARTVRELLHRPLAVTDRCAGERPAGGVGLDLLERGCGFIGVAECIEGRGAHTGDPEAGRRDAGGDVQRPDAGRAHEFDRHGNRCALEGSERRQRERCATREHECTLGTRDADRTVRERARAGIAERERDLADLAVVEATVAVAVAEVDHERLGDRLQLATRREALDDGSVRGVEAVGRNGPDTGAALGERGPEQLQIGGITRGRGGEQRVARLEQRRCVRRQFVCRDEVVLHAGLRLVERQAHVVVEQCGVALPEHRAPHLARVVDLGVGRARLPERRRHGRGQRVAVLDMPEREAVLRQVGRVGHPTDPVVVGIRRADRGEEGVATHRVYARPVRVRGHERILGADAHEHGLEVRPAFTQSARHVRRQPRRVTDQAVADEVPPLMRDDLVVERAIAGDGGLTHHGGAERSIQEFGLERVARSQGQGEDRDRDPARRASRPWRGRAGHIVDDDHADRTGALRVLSFEHERAVATVDQHDLACDLSHVREARATVVGRRDAIDPDDERPRDIE